ncbi:hypothetical protein [Pelagerythrobacter marensis]|uniref:Uncharacterized protein n=1 Tax=Pelagerythrobacter marensis TaxID=543877 RepID=A0A0G3X7L8_9SPHN|nr:hypothetical protein [Pelagerythrobacter marensis]AKM06403.1 hypothetical protein AM2010_315 [Pelagerythrobacter marensis]
MSDTNFASLNSSLLARKGGARPAMRPQSALITGQSAAAERIEDLGWNDMGAESGEEPREAEVLQLTPAPANPATAAQSREIDHEAKDQLGTPEPAKADNVEVEPKPAGPQESPVHRQQAEAAKRLGATIETATPPAPRRSALARGKRAAFTLRLDAERHLKLRLACTMRNRSAQQIVTEALDTMLATMPELDDLAARIERKR